MEGSLMSPSPGLLGLQAGIIDDIGVFDYRMLVTECESDDNGFPSNIFEVTHGGGVLPWFNTMLRGAYAMELDRNGAFGHSILVSNISVSPWWQGDNSVYKLLPDGSKTLLFPDQGLEFQLQCVLTRSAG